MSDAAGATPQRSSNATRGETLRAIIATVLVGSWVGYFLFTGMPQLSLHVFPRTLALHLMIGGLALVYVSALAAKRRLPGGSPLDLPVLAFVAALAIATAASISWRVSLEPVLYTGAAIIVFYALADLPFVSAEDLRRALVLAGTALALYALWVVGSDYLDYVRLVRRVEGLEAGNVFPPTVPRVHDVSDHPNVLAMLLTLVLPFAALSALRGGTRWERVAGIAAMLIGGMAIFLTLSRGGWLGAAAGVGFTGIGAWMTVQAFEREQRGFAPSWENAIPRDISPTALAALGGALVLFVGGTLAFLSSASTRPGWLFRSSLSPREDAWTASLDIFADYPLAGAGPHAFGLLYPQYSGEFLVHTQHAHNGFLQLADDAGVLGLLALAAIAGAIVYMLLKTWREGDLTQRLVAVACGGALLGFSTHNLLDAGNIWKAPPIALALVGAIIVRGYRERVQPKTPAPISLAPESVRRWGMLTVRAALLALVIVPFAAWWRIDRAHHSYYVGADAYNTGDDAAIALLQDAVDADSSVMVYRMLLGQAQAREFNESGRTETLLIREAVVNLEQAKRLDPRSDIARANLARAYQLAGRDEDAAAEAKITRLAAHHVAPVIAVAEVYEDLGRDADAIDTYGQVLSMDASLADSPFFELTEWRGEHFDEIVDSSILALNPCTYGSYLVDLQSRIPAAPSSEAADDLAQAEEGCKLLLISAPNDLVLRVALAKILRTSPEARDAAFGHLTYATERQPDFGPARTELGRWYADGGDLESARRQWVIGEQLNEPESVMLLGDSYRPQDRPAALRPRLRSLLDGYGSSVRNDIISVLYYRLRHGRLSPVTAIIPATWQTAVPRIYAQMRDTLARWEAESP